MGEEVGQRRDAEVRWSARAMKVGKAYQWGCCCVYGENSVP